MSGCQAFGADGPAGVADALQKVDCLATDATATSFGRLFGAHGNFQVALTIILTLYIALLAFNLLTGRSALKLSVLTPRMMTLGLVLTFATSWVAYQSVVWNLATGAPDEVASVLVGSDGSATAMFAQQLDGFFNGITDAAARSQTEAAALAANPAAASRDPAALAASATIMSPATILSIGGLIMLLGTVGVLVVCRLALAALLILGPIFIVLALFEGTRGLFEGWLKSVAMFAFVPLLTVVMGSGAMVAIGPMIASLDQPGAPISLRTAVSILVASIIYTALMLLVFKVAGNLTRSWRLGKALPFAQSFAGGTSFVGATQQAALATAAATAGSASALSSDRVRSTVASIETMSARHHGAAPRLSPVAVPVPAMPAPMVSPQSDARGQMRYLHHRVAGASPNKLSREMLR